jgi:hypothetical protein
MKNLFGILVFIIACASVYLNGMSEGLRNLNNCNVLWHYLNVAYLIGYALTLILMIYQNTSTYKYYESRKPKLDFIKDCLYVLLLIALLRWVGFNYVHNYYFEVGFFYIGETSMLDKLYLNYISPWFPPVFVLTLKIFTFIILFFQISMIKLKRKK